MLFFWWLLRSQAIFFILLAFICLFFGIGSSFFPLQEEVLSLEKTTVSFTAEPSENSLTALFLRLPSSSPVVQLPDLKKYLQFLGKNERPDTTESSCYFHFSLIGDKEVLSIKKGHKAYLAFQRERAADRFQFSPSNQKTSLFFTCEDAQEGVQVQVSFESDIGLKIMEDDKSKKFTLKQQPHLRPIQGEWSVGAVRIDPSYLSKVKARWYGRDQFFEDLGGEDFAHLVGKERISLDGGEKPYFLYASEGEYFVYEKDLWIPGSAASQSEQSPLLEVKAIDDRLMHFVLWDAFGKRQQPLTMIKHPMPQPVREISQEFHFSGAKTKRQFIFDVQEKKMTLILGDWLLHTTELGWMKIDTPALLDQYIEGSIQGDLLVLGEVGKADEQKVLFGRLYSPCRTQKQEVRLPIVKEEMVFGNNEKTKYAKPFPSKL